jgi:hypothetical protein
MTDQIQFSLASSELEDYLTIDIVINGYDLKSIIASIESEQIHNMPLTIQAGAYEGISAFIAFHTHNHFYGETVSGYQQEGNRFTLFEYIHSGVPGEHTVTCEINFSGDEVTWKNFRNISSVIPEGFSYYDLEFRFNREEYLQAIHNFREEKINPVYSG